MKHDDLQRDADAFFQHVILVVMTISAICVTGFLLHKGVL